MDQFFFLANIGTDLADIGRRTALTFGVDWPHFIAQVLSFLIVAAALYRWAYKPIQTVLEERRQRIKEGLDNAERIKGELARTEAQRQDVLGQANTEADRMIEEARAAANRVREQETQKAIIEAEQIVARARQAAEIERTRMLAEARRDLGRLVVATTRQVTGKVLTPEDQRRLADETARQLAQPR